MVGAPGREEGGEDGTPVSGQGDGVFGKGLPGEEEKDLGAGDTFFFLNNHIRKHLFEV